MGAWAVVLALSSPPDPPFHACCTTWPSVYCPQGSLYRLLKKQGSSPVHLYSDEDALRWTKNIVNGLMYLHELQPMIIHRDVRNNIELYDSRECIDVRVYTCRPEGYTFCQSVLSTRMSRCI